MISWYRTTFGAEELARLGEALHREKISQGTVTAEFEKALAAKLGAKHAVVTTSGSVALLMSLLSAGVKPGDEVIVPNRTWVSTAHAALLLGAKVKLVDVLSDKPLMDPAQFEAAITPRTKAVIPVHLCGRACDMTAINRIAHTHGVTVVEDACQAFYSRDAHGWLGTQSDYGCFSFGVTKLISTGQGGAILTSSEDIYERLKLIRNNGTESVHTPQYTRLGFNFKFTDLLASVGIVQLAQTEERARRVREIHERYRAAIQPLPFLKFLPVDLARGETPLYVEAICDDRPSLLKYFSEHDVDVRPFLPDLDSAPHVAPRGDFPHSRPFASGGIFLPGGPAQPEENIEKVIDLLQKFGRKKAPVAAGAAMAK